MRSKFLQALPWEARQDAEGWAIGQPAVVDGKDAWFEVARITAPDDHADTIALMLIAAVNEVRGLTVSNRLIPLEPQPGESCAILSCGGTEVMLSHSLLEELQFVREEGCPLFGAIIAAQRALDLITAAASD